MTMEHSAKAAVLALILINVLFLIVGIWFLREVSNTIREDRDNRNAIVHTLLQTCSFMQTATRSE